MPRTRADYRRTHRAADRFEPQLAAVFRRGVERIRAQVVINDLALALETARMNFLRLRRIKESDIRAALGLLHADQLDEALRPMGAIIRDATLRGGRVGAEILNRARER